MNGSSICRSIITSIKEVISSNLFLDSYRIGNAFTRNRKLSFQNLIFFLLNSTKKSLQINISDFRSDYESLNFPDISKQAVSKARAGISFEAFRELYRISVRQFYQDAGSLKTWHGFHVYGIDGTSLQIPNTKENINTFGSAQNQYSSPCALASASTLYDLMNDIIVDASIDSYCYGERKFALEHLEELGKIGAKANTILLFDRGYPSYEMFRQITESGVFFLMRVQGNMKSITQQESDDCIFDYYPDKPKAGSKPVTLRAVRVILEDGTTEYLVTNILAEFTADMFKELYFLRWGIECKYKEFKSQLEIEEFTGNKPTSVKQDFYANMLISNLVAMIKADADLMVHEEQEIKHNKYKYQSNKGFILSRVKKYLIKMFIFPDRVKEILAGILNEAKKMRSQIRPNRKCERKIRNLRRKHYYNRKSCI